MFQQAVLGFFISPKDTFSNLIMSRVINQYGKGAVIQIATVFRPISHVVC